MWRSWLVNRLTAGLEGLDDDHAPAAARTGAGQYASVIRGHLVLIGLLHVWGNIQELTRPVDVLGPVAVGKQAIMADAVETFWQDVHEEAANELVGMERRASLTPAVAACRWPSHTGVRETFTDPDLSECTVRALQCYSDPCSFDLR